jgi:Sister chromatid cohesion C-terminus
LDVDLQQAVLAGLYDLFQEEEKRNLTEAAKVTCSANDKSVPHPSVVLAAEEDAEAGLLAVCAQAILPELNRASQSKKSDVRNSVVMLLGLLARQGLVLPAKIVPALFGLLVDGSIHCRESALHVVSFLADRHQGMLSSAAMLGVRSCFGHALLTRSSFLRNGPVVETICEYAIDERTGYSYLSQAMSMIHREQRRGILRSIVRAFDPRARTALMHSSPDPSRCVTDEITVDNLGGANCCSSGDGELAPKPESVAPTLSVASIAHEDEEDEFDAAVSTDEACGGIVLQAAGPGAPLSSLIFYAATLATLDYACGAGLGGSFTVGGGTSAAEAKLKAAREDVLEIASVASRIISNSGQAVLEAAQRVVKNRNASNREKEDVARSAVPLCMLLFLKRFLKVTRWSAAAHAVKEDREDDGVGDTVVTIPKFDMSRLPLGMQANGHAVMGCGLDDFASAQLTLFRELMREDCIDDADITAGNRRKRNGRASTATPGKGSGRVSSATPVKGSGRKSQRSAKRRDAARGGSRRKALTARSRSSRGQSGADVAGSEDVESEEDDENDVDYNDK